MREINRVIVHCSASPQGRGDDVETIRGWHTAKKPKGNGWRSIGYHWVILEDGTKQAGLDESKQGIHVKGHNADSIGVCLIGEDSFTEAQFETLRRLISMIRGRWGEIAVYGHYHYDHKKTCPNFDVQDWCNRVGL